MIENKERKDRNILPKNYICLTLTNYPTSFLKSFFLSFPLKSTLSFSHDHPKNFSQ